MVCTVRVTLGCGKHDDRVVRENAYDRTTQSSSLYQGISAGVEAGFGADSVHSLGPPLLVRSPSWPVRFPGSIVFDPFGFFGFAYSVSPRGWK